MFMEEDDESEQKAHSWLVQQVDIPDLDLGKKKDGREADRAGETRTLKAMASQQESTATRTTLREGMSKETA